MCLRILCKVCFLLQQSLVSKTTETLALRNVLDPQLPIHKNGFFRRTFSHLFQVYEFKKYDFPQVVDQVLKDEHIKHAIDKMTLQQFQDSNESDDEFYQELLKSNQKRTKKLLHDMRATIKDDFLLR